MERARVPWYPRASSRDPGPRGDSPGKFVHGRPPTGEDLQGAPLTNSRPSPKCRRRRHVGLGRGFVQGVPCKSSPVGGRPWADFPGGSPRGPGSRGEAREYQGTLVRRQAPYLFVCDRFSSSLRRWASHGWRAVHVLRREIVGTCRNQHTKRLERDPNQGLSGP